MFIPLILPLLKIPDNGNLFGLPLNAYDFWKKATRKILDVGGSCIGDVSHTQLEWQTTN